MFSPLRTINLTILASTLLHAAPAPMEPAERTLFIFVHGINPKCSGAIDNYFDSNADPSWKRGAGCEDEPRFASNPQFLGDFCVDRNQILGRSGQVWVKNLDGKRDQASLFCSLHGSLFGSQYSLRSFSDPGASPIELRHELGDRDWTTPQNTALRSHAIEAMRRYAEGRRDAAVTKMAGNKSLSAFEQSLLKLHPSSSITDLRGIFQVHADSMPSRMVVMAHSMGGLTTREYLMSDFYNQDLDKVITFDSPHTGSWVAYYNQAGPRNWWKASTMSSAAKLGMGYVLFQGVDPVSDQLGMAMTITGAASGVSGLFQTFGGWIGNDFKGDEAGSVYLTPGALGNVQHLNQRSLLNCEGQGCKVPSFTLYSTDGVLAPDDPKKLLLSPLRLIFPTDVLSMASAAYMAFGRDWPASVGIGRSLYLSLVAAAFAEGGWNYSQHGSLPVVNSSSRGSGIPFFDRTDVSVRKPVSLVYDPAYLSDVAGSVINSGARLGAIFATSQALSILGAATGNTPMSAAAKFGIGVGFGAFMGGGATGQFGLYAASYAPSHNLAVWQSANKTRPASYTRADGVQVQLAPKWIEDDLYEAPYAQIRHSVTTESDGSKSYSLKLNTGTPQAPVYPIKVLGTSLQPIRYPNPGWESRWAVREERQVSVQTSGTFVRQVDRWNLPFELLTTEDIRGMELQIDDLRPDLMEQMSITINWGKYTLVWDREKDAQGADLGTFTVTRLDNGTPGETWNGLPNPINNLGLWSLDFGAFLSEQVLQDGQNLLAISLVNHAGKRSTQRQFITWQATPPLVSMTFPQPWEVVSSAQSVLSARATLLYYSNLSFEPSGSGWKLEPADLTQTAPSLAGLMPFPSLEADQKEFQIDKNISESEDGAWTVLFRTVATTLEGETSSAERRVPFFVDQSAPSLSVSTPEVPSQPGVPRDFMVDWTDGPSVLPPTLELVRYTIENSEGVVVAEPEPVVFAVGGKLFVRWNGMVNGQNAPDGSYTLRVVARDGAVPNAEVRQSVLSVKNMLTRDLANWTGKWTSDASSEWSQLRARTDLNWSTASVGFRIDATAPSITFEPLPTTPIGASDPFRLKLRIADAGSTGPKDSVHLRVILTPIQGTMFPEHSLTAAFVGVASTLTAAQVEELGENSDARGVVPDGTWKVSATAIDAAGNKQEWSDLGTVIVDRTPPVVASLRADHLVVSSKAPVSGQVHLELLEAVTIRADWVSPDGTTIPAVVTGGSGQWTVDYPTGLHDSKGEWVLQVHATDAAGNMTSASTQLWVDLAPPRLLFAGTTEDQVPTIAGPVVLLGRATDPAVDANAFRTYGLQWRWKGENDWKTDGMSVPVGRRDPVTSWKSKQEQVSDGVLGTWVPPVGTGSIEVRVLVDDGTALIAGREVIREVYRTSDQPLDFDASTSLPTSLDALISSRLGLDVHSTAPQAASYQAQVSMVDSRGALLFAHDLIDLKASRFEGRPVASVDGAFQVWHDGKWTLRANGACRNFKVRMLVASTDAILFTCPTGWKCPPQEPLNDISLPAQVGGFTARRQVLFEIPAAATGEVSFLLDQPGQLLFEGDPAQGTCPSQPGICPNAPSSAPEGLVSWPTPQPGELVTGGSSLPWCEIGGTVQLDPGFNTWSATWSGVRPDGTAPAGGKATLQALVWDRSTGRLVSASSEGTIREGAVASRSWVSGELSVSTLAPVVQSKATIHFTLEGRGARLRLQILQGTDLVRELEGSGNWFEGRSSSVPYTVTWDGTDAQGTLVAPGTYEFRVTEEGADMLSQAALPVSGTTWAENANLRVSLPESKWDATGSAWRLEPKAELHVSTGAVGFYGKEGDLTYAADWSGKQNVPVYPASRFSVMLNRRRETVKFGILFRGSIYEKRYGNDGATCGGSEDHNHRDRWSGVHIVEVARGGIATVHPDNWMVTGTTDDWIYRWEGGEHTVEYRIVPLSQVQKLQRNPDEGDRWARAKDFMLSSGSFKINNGIITPTFGTEQKAAVAADRFIDPSPPYKCEEDASLEDFGDPEGKGVQTSSNSCGQSSSQNPEFYNPHRNLIRYKLRPALNEGFVGGGATSHCTGNAGSDQFGFNMDIEVPEEYWEPAEGMQNLANRFVRFDSYNKFLFGSNGYASHDDFDNDGHGPADDDDPGENSGSIAAFEHRALQWRPRLLDILQQISDCKVDDLSSPVVTVYGGAPVDPKYSDPTKWRFLYSSPCGSYSCSHYQALKDGVCTKMEWDQSHGQFLPNGQQVERPLEDPFLFFEGDHGRSGEKIRAWLENTPEQGGAFWKTTITQGARSIELSAANVGSANAVEFEVSRGSGTGVSTRGLVDWAAIPVEMKVTLTGTAADFQKSALSKTIAWPLNATTYATEKARIETECKSSGNGDCRLYAAASGVRFGVADGLQPSNSAYSSSAQENFFTALAAGQKPNPETIPGGIPTGGSRMQYNGRMTLDASGYLQLRDHDHFVNPPAGLQLVNANVVPSTIAWDGAALDIRMESNPLRTAVFSTRDLASWTLAQDSRLQGSSRLHSPVEWSASTDVQGWPLLKIYRKGTGSESEPPPVVDQDAALFRHGSSWFPNPTLRQVRLDAPLVAYRTGDPTTGAFVVAEDAGGVFPTVISLRRNARAWGLPEWFPIHGAVPAGQSYQIGWREAGGGWTASGESKLSTCTSEEIAAASCRLGFLDASRLPTQGEVGVLVTEGSARTYRLIPFVQGQPLDPTKNTEAKSLFGEASVVFSPGMLSGKSEAERAITVRTLDPAKSGIAWARDLSVTGPIVEILPSQQFSSTLSEQPQVKVRLSRSELADPSVASSLGLFKIDPTQGVIVPLATRGVTYVCEGAVSPCDVSNYTTVEYAGLTGSFSRFAILPLQTTDSRIWSFDVLPRFSTGAARTVQTSGMGISDLDWYVDDDAIFEDPNDATPPSSLIVAAQSSGQGEVSVSSGVRWIFARPKTGGFAKSVRVERRTDPFVVSSLAGPRVVVGTHNGSVSLPYTSNREGEWTLSFLSGGAVIGSASGVLHEPSGSMDLAGVALGSHWRGSVASRLSLRSSAGEVQDLVGPELVGDANAPTVEATSSVRRVGDQWEIRGFGTGQDPEGPLGNLELRLEASDGRILASTSLGAPRVELQTVVSESELPSKVLRLIARAVDEGGNHAEVVRILDLEWIAQHTVWWTEAEALVELSATLPICQLPSRRAVRSDAARVLTWTLPNLGGRFLLGGRWRSSASATIKVSVAGGAENEWTLPARPLWGDAETWGHPMDLQGGESVRVEVPAGMQWDGLVMVQDARNLVGWKPPETIVEPRAVVMIRDEGPNDANMSHPRYFVTNTGSDALDGYEVRYQVRVEPGLTPLHQVWWPSALETRWVTDGHDVWDLVLDRVQTSLPAGQSDFQGAGPAMGIYYSPWQAWDRSDDPSWSSETHGSNFVASDRIPVFTRSGELVSAWTCVEDVAWADPAIPPNVGQMELRSSSPLVLADTQSSIVVKAEGQWGWTTTVLGFSPLDGIPLDGTVTVGGNNFPLSGWWQEIRVPNTGRQDLSVEVIQPAGRKIQIQKWEN